MCIIFPAGCTHSTLLCLGSWTSSPTSQLVRPTEFLQAIAELGRVLVR